MTRVLVDREPLSLGQLRDVWRQPAQIGLDNAARKRVEASAARIRDVLARGVEVYGVNTGFGLLANVHVGDDELDHLQDNLIRSHAVGVGAPLPDETVRLVLVMKIKALAEGYSGVRPDVIDAVCALVNNGIYPVVPQKGSVGASGDLAPLAHVASAMRGVGDARVGGETMPAADALQGAGLAPLK